MFEDLEDNVKKELMYSIIVVQYFDAVIIAIVYMLTVFFLLFLLPNEVR